jgi:hypothetical protein
VGKAKFAHINNFAYDSQYEEQRFQALIVETRRYVRDGPRLSCEDLFQRRQSVLPMHGNDLGAGLVAAIKKQLGLK